MVAMNVWPTDGAAGSVATELQWRKMGRLWAPSGVVQGVGGEMAPSLAGTNLTVQAGSCWVDGHFCELTSTQVLTTTANGLCVVRFDPAANSAQLLYLDGVSTPTQNPTGTWELPIAQIVGSALTDLRGITITGAGGDTGWINLTPVSGSGTFQYRCLAHVVYVRANLTGITSIASAAFGPHLAAGVLPIIYRPGVTAYTASSVGGAYSGLSSVATDGSSGTWNNNGIAVTTARFSLSYAV